MHCGESDAARAAIGFGFPEIARSPQHDTLKPLGSIYAFLCADGLVRRGLIFRKRGLVGSWHRFGDLQRMQRGRNFCLTAMTQARSERTK